MPAEHIGLDGKLYQGYFCARCGKPCNMMATGHGLGKCEPISEDDLDKLWELNK